MRFKMMLGTATTMLVAMACTAQDSSTPQPVGTGTQPILGGQLDTTSQSVVAVALGQEGSGQIFGACTGALVKVDRSKDVAYVLTAAHCVTAGIEAYDVRIGNDWTNPTVTMPVASVTTDPDYTGSGTGTGIEHDFAVVALRNLPASLPTPYDLPTSSDGLGLGSTVRIVGYGNTISYGNPDGVTTRRRTANLVLDRISSQVIEYDQSNGVGPCDGDSGGPALSGTTVVGVTSYGYSLDDDIDSCLARGISSRVTAALPFIQAILDGQPPPPPNACNVCRTQANSSATCRAKQQACENNAQCSNLVACLSSQSADQQACLNQYPGGQGPLYDWLDCPCADVCAQACAGQSACADTAKCGSLELPSNTIGRCVESNCCAELDRASADPLGFRCLTESGVSGCAGNSAYAAYDRCVTDACEDGPSSSSSGGSSSGAVGDEDAGAIDEEDDDDRRRRSSDDEGGCSTRGPGRAGETGLALLAVGALLAARRRR